MLQQYCSDHVHAQKLCVLLLRSLQRKLAEKEQFMEIIELASVAEEQE